MVEDDAGWSSSGRACPSKDSVSDSPKSCWRSCPVEELPWIEGNDAITFGPETCSSDALDMSGVNDDDVECFVVLRLMGIPGYRESNEAGRRSSSEVSIVAFRRFFRWRKRAAMTPMTMRAIAPRTTATMVPVSQLCDDEVDDEYVGDVEDAEVVVSGAATNVSLT